MAPLSRRTVLQFGVVIAVLVLLLAGVFVSNHVVFGLSDGPPRIPDAKITASYYETAGQLNLTHSGGPPFTNDSTATVEVQVNGNIEGTVLNHGDRRVENGIWVNDNSTGLLMYPVHPGTSVFVDDLASGDEVRVIWTLESGERRTLLSVEV